LFWGNTLMMYNSFYINKHIIIIWTFDFDLHLIMCHIKHWTIKSLFLSLQYLLEAGWGDDGKVIGVTESRRVAATTLAMRVAEEKGSPLGRTVGYSIRFDDCFSPVHTRIKVSLILCFSQEWNLKISVQFFAFSLI
jgi:hypothetical protein